MTETFRVVPSTTPLPSALMTGKRHRAAEDAIAAMGRGVVVAHEPGSGLRLVAYHEDHAAYVERTGGVVTITQRAEPTECRHGYPTGPGSECPVCNS